MKRHARCVWSLSSFLTFFTPRWHRHFVAPWNNPVPGVTDTRTTAGAENKIVLSVVPEVTKPDGTSFQWTADGSDAAFVVAQVEDGNGNLVSTAADNVTFSVTGPATYMGGTQQLVADPSWTNYYQDAFSQANSSVIQGVPYAFFHSPGDPELNFEGGLQKIAPRSTFTPGTVTVTASAPGLASGSVTLTSVAPPAPSQSQPPAIIVPPVNTATTLGYSVTFIVAASGSGTLSYQWSNNNGQISGATNPTYTTPPTTAADNGDCNGHQQLRHCNIEPGHPHRRCVCQPCHHHATGISGRSRRTSGNIDRRCDRLSYAHVPVVSDNRSPRRFPCSAPARA